MNTAVLLFTIFSFFMFSLDVLKASKATEGSHKLNLQAVAAVLFGLAVSFSILLCTGWAV